MIFTSLQKKAMNYVGMAKVVYRNMWNTEHQLGYVSPDSPIDKITIAKDFPDKDVKKIALLHEVGHIYYGHTSVDNKQELKDIFNICKELGKDFMMVCATYGGPMGFLNVAMDIEVNSKLLTLANVKHMNQFVQICTPDAYDVPYMNSFRDYYRPLIEKVEDGKAVPQLSEGLQDISSGVSGFDSDLPEEIKEELRKEGYRAGDSRDNKSGDESTVSEELDKADKEADGKMYGTEHKTGSPITIVNNSSKEIRQFLSKILNSAMIYTPDAFKHYNRGTRRNDDGLLYNSMRRRNKMDKRKIAFVCDVSGSMNSDSVIKAVSSLMDSIEFIAPNSSLIFWDTRLCAEYSIAKLPKTAPSGGGTDMASALKYVAGKGFTDVVLYSDLETNMVDLIKCAKQIDHLYTIVDTNERFDIYDKYNSEYIRLNRGVLYVR